MMKENLRDNLMVRLLARDPAVVKTAARILKYGWSEKEENVEVTKSFEPSAKPIGNISISYDRWKPSVPNEPVAEDNTETIRLRRNHLSDGDYVTILKEMNSIITSEIEEVSKGIKTDDQSGDVPESTDDVDAGISIEE
jgi:hypothetical protein